MAEIGAMMKDRSSRSGLAALLCVLAFVIALGLLPTRAFAQEPSVTATIETANIDKHGNVSIGATCAELTEAFAFGDVVTVSFLDQSIDVPFCSAYSDVDSGESGLFARSNKELGELAINMGNFATAYGVATKTVNEDSTFFWTFPEGVEEPVTVTITLKEAGGYYDQYVMHQLSYTNERTDYPQLTDDQFANFREVTTTGMGSGVLYRSASPVDPKRNRNTYADAAIERVGVTAIVNLTDAEEDLAAFEGYDQTYYSTVEHVALSMDMDVLSDENRGKLAEGLRFMAQHRGIYAVHCLEGKDRTGFVVAVLECLMGASKDEVVADYMETYYNYYGVTADDERYDVIANSNIVKSLSRAFGLESLDGADLAAAAEAYLYGIGLTYDELAALKANLNPITTVLVTFEMGGHGCAPQVQEVAVGACATRPSDPIASGFTFAGWYANAACTQEFDFATPLKQDTVLYAKWVKASCPSPSAVYPTPVYHNPAAVNPITVYCRTMLGRGLQPMRHILCNPYYAARITRFPASTLWRQCCR